MVIDYREKLWGGGKSSFSLTSLYYLKLKWFLADIPLEKGRLLDLGCGLGSLTAGLKEKRPQLEVIGVDISPQAIQNAQEKFTGPVFFEADIYHLPFKNESLDIVTGFDVLEHFSQPKKALKETFRVLKEGGTIHFSSPLENQPGTLYWLLADLGWQAKKRLAGHQQRFSRQSFLDLIKESGFTIKKQRFSFQFLGQGLDVLFYLFLANRLTRGLEEEIESQPCLRKVIFRFLKAVLVGLANLESLLFQKIGGACLHLTGVKIKNN